MIRIPEVKVAGKPLGRHIHHRTLHAVRANPVVSPDLKTTYHQRLVPVFDQGNLSSCTGNASVGACSTAPFSNKGDEAEAISIYSFATELDPSNGVFPPNDVGSTGNDVARACYLRGLCKGWYSLYTLADVLWALQIRPGITGISWLTDCDNPDANGLVSYSGTVRGGHEIELVGLDVEKKLIWMCNSWGPSWGKNGYFCMSWADYEKALADNGDATFLT